MRRIVYGDEGPTLLYFPSSGGDETEFESYGLKDEARPWLEQGRLRVISVDGWGPRTFWCASATPKQRIGRYAAFERYLVRELLPAVGGRPSLVGCSYGGFVAANLLLKFPERVELACGLGGVYGLWHRLDGYRDDDVYFHTPLDYLPGLRDEKILSAIRRTRGLWCAAAAADRWLQSTLDLTRILKEKGLPHRSAIWPAPADHHQRWWRRQFAVFLERAFPLQRS